MPTTPSAPQSISIESIGDRASSNILHRLPQETRGCLKIEQADREISTRRIGFVMFLLIEVLFRNTAKMWQIDTSTTHSSSHSLDIRTTMPLLMLSSSNQVRQKYLLRHGPSQRAVRLSVLERTPHHITPAAIARSMQALLGHDDIHRSLLFTTGLEQGTASLMLLCNYRRSMAGMSNRRPGWRGIDAR